MREVYEAWNRVRAALKSSGDLNEYASVIEFQEREGQASGSAPHLHVLMTGRYIPQRRLSELAVGRVGTGSGRFGAITDIRAVRGTGSESAVEYLTKQLAGEMAAYVSKVKGEQLKKKRVEEAAAKRVQVRPVRLSRGWYPGGFAAAEKVARLELFGHGESSQVIDDWQVWMQKEDGSFQRLGKASAERPPAQQSAPFSPRSLSEAPKTDGKREKGKRGQRPGDLPLAA